MFVEVPLLHDPTLTTKTAAMARSAERLKKELKPAGIVSHHVINTNADEDEGEDA